MAEQSIGALASNLIDPWRWWQAALKDPASIGKTLPVHEGEPNQGYFRTRFKGGVWEPVAIWKEDGQWLAYRSGKEVRADDIWTFACRSPITYEAYENAMVGNGWADDDKVVAAQVKPPEPTIGDNSGEVDEAETLKDQIAAALAGMTAYEKITDDKTAAKALSLRNRLNELSGHADKIRVKQKEPHLEAGKAVDAKWQPLVKNAKAGADKVRDAIGAWETVKLQEQRRIAREAEHEQARVALEEAARAVSTDAEVMEAPAVVAAPVETAPAPIKPTYGKTASVSVKVVVDEVTDWTALYTYMAARPEVQDLLRSLAQKALDAGRTNVPGITTLEKAAVR